MQKYIILLFPLLLFTALCARGQEHPSIHQAEYEKYRDLPRRPPAFDISGDGIIPLQERNANELTAAVFGYFPYWKYPDALPNMQFDLLSHIALFDFSVASTGNITPPSAWPWSDLINAAHEAGVKVILTAVNFTGSQIHQLLTNAESKQNLFTQLKSYLQTYQLQGVNIDFESIYESDRGEVLNGFMAELTAYLHSEIPGSEVSIAVPPVNWGGWQFTGLAQSCDYLFIMGYNFYGPWSETSGACAPLTGGSYNITRSVNYTFGEVAENHSDKLILGVPYYANKWKTENGGAYAPVIDHISQPTYSLAKNIADEYGVLWDPVSQTSYCSYLEDDDWYQVWYDSDSSLRLKYDLADSKNYKGIGMWALGYDSDKPELWDEIRRRYTGASAVNEFRLSRIDVQVTCNGNILKAGFTTHKNDRVLLALYNTNGKLCHEINFNASSNGVQILEIPLREQLAGVYIVHVTIQSTDGMKYGAGKVFIR